VNADRVIALASVLGGTLVGAAGVAVAWATSASQREHARELARDERLFTVRKETYREMLELMHRRTRAMDATYPKSGPQREAPDQPTQDDLIHLDAVIGAFGSDEVRKAAAKWGDIVADFWHWSRRYRTLIETKPVDDAKRQHEFTLLDARREVARKQLLDLEALVQEELSRA